MRRPQYEPSSWLALIITLLALPAWSMQPAPASETPHLLLDAWVELWATYDLDHLQALFLQDDRLTYFSSETEGLLRGYDRIVEHHRGFGFQAGGSQRDSVIWVDDVEIVELADTAVIGAIWYFGDPDSPDGAQHGPMSVVAVRTDEGYRIAHMHFATYSASQRP